MSSCLAAWLVLAAEAHPFGARFAAHLTNVDVGPDRVSVRYTADVPNPIVATATRTPGVDPVEAMAEELRTGLVLLVNGEVAPMSPDGPWSVRPTEDTHRYTWALSAGLEAPPATVELSNGNLPDVPAVFRAHVDVADGWEIAESTLWRVRDGVVELDESDLWRTDERHRTLTVAVRERRSALWPALLGLGLVVAFSAIAALRAQPQRPRATRSPPG